VAVQPPGTCVRRFRTGANYHSYSLWAAGPGSWLLRQQLVKLLLPRPTDPLRPARQAYDDGRCRTPAAKLVGVRHTDHL